MRKLLFLAAVAWTAGSSLALAQTRQQTPEQRIDALVRALDPLVAIVQGGAVSIRLPNGTTGPADSLTVGGTAIAAILGSKAPLANPTFSGTVTAPSYGGDVSATSVRLPGAGNTARTLADKLDDYAVSVLDFAAASGVTPASLRACSGNAGPAFQAAADKVISRGGGSVLLPKGLYCFGPTDTVVVNGPVDWIGEGRGANSGAGYFGGTLVRTTNPTGDVFTVKARGGNKFRNFAIDGYGVSGGKTAGAAISVSGDALTDYASGSEISGMFFGGGLWDAIRAPASINWSIFNNNIIDFKHIGVDLSCEGGSNPDGSTGHLTVGPNNLIWAFNTQTIAQAGVRYQCGGDVRVLSNKILGAKYGVWLNLTRGPTGTLTIVSNSLEQQTVNQIRAERAPSAGPEVTFGNLQINSNQLSILELDYDKTNFQGAVALVDSSSPWLTNVTISDNVFNHGVNKAFPFVSVRAGRGVVVAHNVMTNLGNPGGWGFDVGGSATKVLLDQNEAHDMPAGLYNTVGPAALVRDTINRPIVSSLGTYADGSEIYTADGVPGSAPMVGGGSGTLARQVSGVWQSADQGAWINYTPTVAPTSGTITTLGAVTGRRQITGKSALFSSDIAITANGSGTGNLTVTLPAVPATAGAVFGKGIQGTDKPIMCSFDAGNPTAFCKNLDGSYPAGDNTRFILSGSYQAQ